MTGLIGLALLAAPITAAAQNHDNGKNNSPQSQSQSRQDSSASHSYNAPARSNGPTRNVAPAPASRKAERPNMTRNEFRDQRGARTVNTAPEATAHRDWRADRNEARNDAHRDWREGRSDGGRWNHDRDYDYRNYSNRGYGPYASGAPYYVMPRGYAGGACAWARHLRHVYYQDRNSGHPAAAADLLPQLRRAERNCGGVPYGYNRYRYWR